MTKSDLIEHLCLSEKIPKGKAELLVNAIFDCMEDALRRGERIEIRGFGSFEIRHYKPYDGRNPRTGSQVAVRAKRLPFFKVGKELKERVNGPEPEDAADGRKTGANGHGNGHASNGASNGHHMSDGGAEPARPAQPASAPTPLASPSPPPGEAKAKAS